ncbi:hypothetical protein BO221_15055 [Archangium sp. Cb G35]|uniref:hypothetical protein n=1 Tax=Archangium sp. Cb G35 TaxID=1920190 RepID=UPI000936D83E|nr:hypothetical protein [Archangium sp. Cb G35]OJT24468.1 hypothetical protein BO221_15055 [Archangium sp. Cb G35]
MIDPESMAQLRKELRERMVADRKLLEDLRAEVRSGLGDARRIMPRQTTAVSLVGTDGGNNRIEFDPFMAQLIRVVDSSNNEYCLEVVTPTTNLAELSKRHITDGTAHTALGKMMKFLGASTLWELSPMIKKPPAIPSPSWVQVYRELTEWAVLFSLVREKDYGTDTVIVWDGLLRSKVFSGTLFAKLRQGIDEGIREQKTRRRRSIYVVGVAKHSKVLQRYRLAMMLEGSMRCDYPCYADVSRELEQNAYVWSEYARGGEVESGEANKFVAGKMFFVKFGGRPRDPIWPVDLFESQINEAQVVFGSLLADAIEGFPVPFYPRCLQRAHENAALVDFDMDILQQGIVTAIRESLGESAPVLDELALIDADPAAKRYG